MNKLFLSCIILINFAWILIYAELQYPADVSYLVSDLKYSQEHGLKICEVQHGALSALSGDLYVSGEDGAISPKIADFFTFFPIKKWAAGLLYPPLQRSLAVKEWQIVPSVKILLQDSTFLECAKVHSVDPCCITSYAGIVYADLDIVGNFDYYRKLCPGILFLNAATFPYWNDKYKMNALFDYNDELKQYKADWRIYPKKYDVSLSQQIQQEMPGELYVIKPRKESLANGVIVVANKDLDTVLQMILEPIATLEKHPDKKYAYWWKNRDDSFLIEKYYTSDYVCFSAPLSGNMSCATEYQYDATMRIACIMHYDGGRMRYHSLGGFWKLPAKSLQEQGTLNEQRISCCKPPFYTAVDSQLLKEVNTHIERAMLLLYEIMLSSR
ncbi:MAG TPA: hypothetical protein VGT41_05800 [Candidatus Babeliales bacterium]|nr:hypothetical protein [Candidatus Babeliales bacterium]